MNSIAPVDALMTDLHEVLQDNGAWAARIGDGSGPPAELDDEMMKRLQSLGYLGSGGSD